MEHYNMDYKETYSNVANLTSAQVLLPLALHKGWPLHQLAIKNTLFRGALTETLYMQHLPGSLSRRSFVSYTSWFVILSSLHEHHLKNSVRWFSRSLAACEQLYNAGFSNLLWVQGGLEAAEEEDFQREGPQPFKLAAIGGVSEFFRWTDQQRLIAAKEGWGYRLTFTGRLIGSILFLDALFLGAQRLGPLLQELRSH